MNEKHISSVGYYAVMKIIISHSNNEDNSCFVLHARFVIGTAIALYVNYLIFDSLLHETGTITVCILHMKTEAEIN